MNSQMNIDAFLEAAALVARQVGIMARRLQGQVKNEGKPVTEDRPMSDYERRMTEAKTAIDEIAQDMIITALLPHLPPGTVLDGEEETPGKALMPAQTGEYVLVIDPIDGTLPYLEGGKTYSVNIGLFRDGKVVAALLYYPVFDTAYYSDGRAAYRAVNVAAEGLLRCEPVHFAPLPLDPKRIYVYGAVRKAVRDELEAAGYDTVKSFRHQDVGSASEGILAGGVAIAVVDTIQVRDLMHVAILTTGHNDWLFSWKGEPVKWPLLGGAMPPTVMSMWPLPQDVKDILARHA